MMGSVLFSRRWMNQRLSLNQKGLHKAMLVLEVLVSVCSLSIIDQSRLSGLWLGAGKHSRWRAHEMEHIGQNAISEPLGYCQ